MTRGASTLGKGEIVVLRQEFHNRSTIHTGDFHVVLPGLVAGNLSSRSRREVLTADSHRTEAALQSYAY
jgi:hypothetical protein